MRYKTDNVIFYPGGEKMLKRNVASFGGRDDGWMMDDGYMNEWMMDRSWIDDEWMIDE